MNKKTALEETIKCLEHLMSNIGEKTTEYHWREFAEISKNLVESFPEYDLNNVIENYYNTIKSTQNE